MLDLVDVFGRNLDRDRYHGRRRAGGADRFGGDLDPLGHERIRGVRELFPDGEGDLVGEHDHARAGEP